MPAVFQNRTLIVPASCDAVGASPAPAPFDPLSEAGEILLDDERELRLAALAANDAFAARMTRAIQKCRVHPPVGVRVDRSPFRGRAVRAVVNSCCGSPSADCVAYA